MSKDTPSDHRRHIESLEQQVDYLTDRIDHSENLNARYVDVLRGRRRALRWAIPWLWLVYELERVTTHVALVRRHEQIEQKGVAGDDDSQSGTEQ